MSRGLIVGDNGHVEAAARALQYELLVAAGLEVLADCADEDEPADDHEGVRDPVAGVHACEVGMGGSSGGGGIDDAAGVEVVRVWIARGRGEVAAVAGGPVGVRGAGDAGLEAEAVLHEGDAEARL